MTDKVLFIFEMIGVIACAASGTASGINKHMDAFGVTFLAVITAMGGGIIRDLILGAIPPVAFIKPVYVAAATAVSLTMFFIHRYFKKQSLGKLHNFVFVYMDAVGLGAFTVVGIKKAVIMYGFSHLFLVLTTGFITGIGGGILRDVLAGDTPAVFIKYFYAWRLNYRRGALYGALERFGRKGGNAYRYNGDRCVKALCRTLSLELF